ncbi:MAG: GNAT family N-acetyltransferase [Leptolinea sp.]|nr:GNAT family N-acetyltransferase [Leptolinea sp.]
MEEPLRQNNPAGKIVLRPVTASDLSGLSTFFKSPIKIQHHLDWRTSLEWVGYQPYYILLKHNEILAAMATPVDPDGVAWIRVFGSPLPERLFPILLEKCLHDLEVIEPRPVLAALGLQEWFVQLLEQNTFTQRQKIVVLGWDFSLRPARPIPPELSIRPMTAADLPTVATVDRMAFKPLWQNSLDALILAFHKASIATVACINEQVIGYQISTSTPINTHLARLAVHPSLQRKNIGYELVRNMQTASLNMNSWQVTVNTQGDNEASLALYRSLGFTETGETFPVFVHARID